MWAGPDPLKEEFVAPASDGSTTVAQPWQRNEMSTLDSASVIAVFSQVGHPGALVELGNAFVPLRNEGADARPE